MARRRLLRCLVLVALVHVGVAGVACSDDLPLKRDYRAGEVIVRFRPPYSFESFTADETLATKLQQFAPVQVEKLACAGNLLIKFNEAGGSAELFTKILKESPAASNLFEYVEPNYPFQLTAKRTLSPLAHVNPAGIPAEDWNLTKVSARQAWEKVTDASKVIVAVVDSGVFYSHPDIAGNVWTNRREKSDEVDNDNNGVVDDIHGACFSTACRAPGEPKELSRPHGTLVAGIIGATGNNRPTVRGIAPKAQIMSVKFAADGFAGTAPTPSEAVNAIGYAINNGASIVNISWGSDEPVSAIKSCIDQVAKEHPEVLFVASAGNCKGNNCQIDVGDAPHYPASYGSPNTIVVTSTDWNDALGAESGWSSSLVDLAAPGYLVTSIATPDVHGGYFRDSGTTLAAPHVSAAAALLLALHPNWDFGQLKSHLMASTDKLPQLQGKVASGGRLNVAKAVTGPLQSVSAENGNVWKIGSAQSIRWEVSYQTPVCMTVDIRWSTDGGVNFPLTLIAGAKNTGKQLITAPGDLTSQGKIRIQCSDTQLFSDGRELVTIQN